MRYAQFVMGPAGSGKVSKPSLYQYDCARILLFFCASFFFISPTSLHSKQWPLLLPYLLVNHLLHHRHHPTYLSVKSTYCSTIVRHCESMKRTVHVLNMDPGKHTHRHPHASFDCVFWNTEPCCIYIYGTPAFRVLPLRMAPRYHAMLCDLHLLCEGL